MTVQGVQVLGQRWAGLDDLARSAASSQWSYSALLAP
jgi:hypothetical protein